MKGPTPQVRCHDQPDRQHPLGHEIEDAQVTNWKNGAMAPRWATSSFVETEKAYRGIIGHEQLGTLKAQLDEPEPVAEMRIAS